MDLNDLPFNHPARARRRVLCEEACYGFEEADLWRVVNLKRRELVLLKEVARLEERVQALKLELGEQGSSLQQLAREKIRPLAAAEDDAVLAALRLEPSPLALAALLKIGRTTVYRRLEGMRRRGLVVKRGDADWRAVE